MERHSDSMVELRRMAIHEDHRRQGIASHLIAHLESEALARGFSRVELSTAGHMMHARKLYESLGYTLQRTETTDDWPPEVLQIVFYAKDLERT